MRTDEEILLAEVEADSMVVFCGAGLSRAHPSAVPSAVGLARQCAEQYERRLGHPMPPDIVDDLEGQAELLLKDGQLESLMLGRLIDWTPFMRDPNAGHTSVADFLACGALAFAVTTNVDCLVETAALELGEPKLWSALDGKEANAPREHKPYLKVHGCSWRDPQNTVWCKGQLSQAPIRERLKSSTDWLRATLQGKAVVFVGFWSEWAYLNEIFMSSLDPSIVPKAIFLIDPDESKQLEKKAPLLWAWASQNPNFRHIRKSGADFLDSLRAEFSRTFLISMMRDSEETYKALYGSSPPTPTVPSSLATSDVYSVRRDACGQPVGSVTRQKRPRSEMRETGAAHLRLLEAGAKLEGTTYVLRDKRIRVVHGAGRVLSDVRRSFSNEPPAPLPVDAVICAGARDDGGVPGSIVRGHPAPGIVRTGPAGIWLPSEGLDNYIRGGP